MKLAILGGSFNPVHMGHLFLADAALTGLGYDRIILIPAFQSPFKPGAEGASPRDRLDMLAASIPAESRLTIDDCEIRREGVSYTIDTIADIRERYHPEGKPGLILGDDLAETFSQWRSAGEIAGQADLIIARRLIPQEKSSEGAFPYPHKKLDNEIIEISSHLVRERLRQGGAWRYLVPAGARYIIEDRRLYGLEAGDPAAAAVMAATAAVTAEAADITMETAALLEDAARMAISSSRFLHSRNTALLCWDLCRRFGLDPKAGYLAGITHDMCKSMPDEELISLARADGDSISKIERKKPSLLHGRAAAVLLREKFGVSNQDILDAVRFHTTGGSGMNPLAKVVYIADKIELSRAGVDPGLRELGRSAALDELFEAVLGQTVAWLRSRKLEVSGETRRLLGAMQKKEKT